MKLFAQAAVAIDGSKYKAVNARDRNFTPNKVAERKEQIEQRIKRYLDALDTADRTLGPVEFKAKAEHLKAKHQDDVRPQRSDSCSLAIGRPRQLG